MYDVREMTKSGHIIRRIYKMVKKKEHKLDAGEAAKYTQKRSRENEGRQGESRYKGGEMEHLKRGGRIAITLNIDNCEVWYEIGYRNN